MRSVEGLYLRFGEALDPRVNDSVMEAALALSQGRPAGITEVIPSFASVYVEYDRGWLSVGAEHDLPIAGQLRTADRVRFVLA